MQPNSHAPPGRHLPRSAILLLLLLLLVIAGGIVVRVANLRRLEITPRGIIMTR